jgi:hypothetical protein
MNFSISKGLLIFVASAIAGSLLSGCGPKAPTFTILPTSQGIGQGTIAANKVDILWVIDNSGSMLTKQQNLAASFDSFASIFVNKDFDFNMAIVTTDLRTVAAGGQEGFFQGAPSVINSSTPNFANIFKTNVVVGALGDANAKGIDAINTSLSTTLLNGANSGFLRSDAYLAVLVLSDADDTSSVTSVANTVTFLDSLKPALDQPGGGTKRNYSVSSVVVDTSNAANTICPLPYEDGVKFKQLSALTGGDITSICEANFASGLLNLSLGIAETITQVTLARPADPGTIVVSFDGMNVPQSATDGWTYVSATRKLVFHGNYIPTRNMNILVQFTPTDIIR